MNVRNPFPQWYREDPCFFVLLCIFGYPKFIPDSVEALLGLWGLGSTATAGSQGGSWAWNWKTKRVLCSLPWA